CKAADRRRAREIVDKKRNIVGGIAILLENHLLSIWRNARVLIHSRRKWQCLPAALEIKQGDFAVRRVDIPIEVRHGPRVRKREESGGRGGGPRSRNVLGDWDRTSR